MSKILVKFGRNSLGLGAPNLFTWKTAFSTLSYKIKYMRVAFIEGDNRLGMNDSKKD